jgi:hypothetical protein
MSVSTPTVTASCAAAAPVSPIAMQAPIQPASQFSLLGICVSPAFLFAA